MIILIHPFHNHSIATRQSESWEKSISWNLQAFQTAANLAYGNFSAAAAADAIHDTEKSTQSTEHGAAASPERVDWFF
jgi:hypothetical protein